VIDEASTGHEEGEIKDVNISDQPEGTLTDIVGASNDGGKTLGSMNNIMDGGSVPASKKKGLFGMMG
jgi:hypothetical protein